MVRFLGGGSVILLRFLIFGEDVLVWSEVMVEGKLVVLVSLCGVLLLMLCVK